MFLPLVVLFFCDFHFVRNKEKKDIKRHSAEKKKEIEKRGSGP